MKRKITPPIRKRIEYMLDNRWPYQEIERTTGILAARIAKEFPGRGWTPQEKAEWMLVQKGDPEWV